MKPLIFFTSLIFVLTRLPVAHAQVPPRGWVEKETGHRVIRLSGDEGGSSLYFHQNTYTPKGDKLIFDTRAGIAAVDLTKLGQEPVKPESFVPAARAIAMAFRTPDVYYRKGERFTPGSPLMATNIDTKETRELTKARGS